VKQWWYCLLVVFIALPLGASEMSLNMTQGVTDISGKVYGLHMTILYICCAIGLVVFGIMIYSMIYHRKSKGAVAANFHESTKVEIAWTVIPFIILIAMAIPATKTLIAMEDPSNADLTIKITGSQWKWHYSYFDKDIEFYSTLSTPRDQIDGIEAKGEHYLLEVDKPLVLPINQKVRFLMTSDDVIHSWWFQLLRLKKMPIQALLMKHGPALISPEFIVANVPNCAVKTMDLCQLWCKHYQRQILITG